MKFIDLSLYALYISYKSNIWINKILNSDFNDLLSKNRSLDRDTIIFLKNNFTNVIIQQGAEDFTPNISIFIYKHYLLISFSGIRNYRDLLCCLDYNLKYDNLFNCNIHSGILKIFYNIIDFIINIVQKYEKNNYRVIFQGHSLGAAIAKLVCIYFAIKNQTKYGCVTFSCPLVGDQSFGDLFNNCVENTINFSNSEDFAVNLPLNRKCIEKNKYMINDNGEIVVYELISRQFIWNLLKYECKMHLLEFFYDKLIVDNADLSIISHINIF